tara:strand:+ start:1233 stop:1910 length:678 start_codon:yes stop_codon:yes gene_type:complete
MVIACFPFVFTQMLPLLTYAGLLVVPVGGIVFAEHVLFPKIGLTRYWAKYQNLTKSTPAIASWALALVFGFGLNTLDIISFYYLFIPTWIFTIIIYTLLANKYGAGLDYSEHIKADEIEQKQIAQYQNIMAKGDNPHVEDNSKLTKLLNGFAFFSLVMISILAARVMFYSPTMEIYTVNKSLFETICLVCTVIYFSCSYVALRRHKKLNYHTAEPRLMRTTANES